MDKQTEWILFNIINDCRTIFQMSAYCFLKKAFIYGWLCSITPIETKVPMRKFNSDCIAEAYQRNHAFEDGTYWYQEMNTVQDVTDYTAQAKEEARRKQEEGVSGIYANR